MVLAPRIGGNYPGREAEHTATLMRADALKSQAWAAQVRGDAAERERFERDAQRERDLACVQNELDARDFVRMLRLACDLYPSQVRFYLESLLEEKERIDLDVDRRLDALELAAAETAIALEDMGVTA